VVARDSVAPGFGFLMWAGTFHQVHRRSGLKLAG
jgi:hypothetical protein